MNAIEKNIIRFEKEYNTFSHHPFGKVSYEVKVRLIKTNFFCSGKSESTYYSDSTVDKAISLVSEDLLRYHASFEFHDCTGYKDIFEVVLKDSGLEEYYNFKSLFMEKFLEVYEKYIAHFIEKRILINLKNILFENINNTSI